jgi:hypothetical protein
VVLYRSVLKCSDIFIPTDKERSASPANVPIGSRKTYARFAGSPMHDYHCEDRRDGRRQGYWDRRRAWRAEPLYWLPGTHQAILSVPRAAREALDRTLIQTLAWGGVGKLPLNEGVVWANRDSLEIPVSSKVMSLDLRKQRVIGS